jgi:hypothetical protein
MAITNENRSVDIGDAIMQHGYRHKRASGDKDRIQIGWTFNPLAVKSRKRLHSNIFARHFSARPYLDQLS